jgi:hypothetical protein
MASLKQLLLQQVQRNDELAAGISHPRSPHAKCPLPRPPGLPRIRLFRSSPWSRLLLVLRPCLRPEGW